MKKNKNSELVQEEVVETTDSTQDVIQEQPKGERANRIAISMSDGIFKATFYRTHRNLCTILSTDTKWKPNKEDNRILQRESFRKWLTKHADEFGINWQPQDMRNELSIRVAKYSDEQGLIDNVKAFLHNQISDFIDKCQYELSIYDIEIDDIEPITVTGKGNVLSDMGIIDGKYKNGNWAWATINTCVILDAENEKIFLNLQVQLVSGQLKKPTAISNTNGYTQTVFNNVITDELKAIGVIQEKSKDETVKEEK